MHAFRHVLLVVSAALAIAVAANVLEVSATVAAVAGSSRMPECGCRSCCDLAMHVEFLPSIGVQVELAPSIGVHMVLHRGGRQRWSQRWG